MTAAGRFFRSVLILINIAVIICYLITCLSPFINTGQDWFLAFPGLIFPLLFFTLIFFIIIWFFSKSIWRWISLVALLAGIQQITTAFAFNIPNGFSEIKAPNTLRVLQWNVSGWDQNNSYDKNGNSYRSLMFDLIKDKNADVLCLEEFYEPKKKKSSRSSIGTLINSGYPYHYYIPSVNDDNDSTSGIAIFSKYEVIDSANFAFNNNGHGEHLLYFDIKVADKIFRIFATHLQSVHFEQTEYQSLSKIKHAGDPGFHESRTIVAKLKRGYESRYKQAELVKQKLVESPYPSIICGDFNDVPNSATYFKIKGNMQDAFLKKGFFLGRTFRFISPTLRIDYILADKKFTVSQYRRINVPYSDHYPVEADLQY